MKPLPAQFFASNRQRLQAALPKAGIVVLAAHQLMQRSYDTEYAFQQQADFFYLTGISEPNLTLVITPEETWLIVPKRSQIMQIFYGAWRLDELTQQSGITEVLDEAEGWNRLRAQAKKYKQLYTLVPPRRGAEDAAPNPAPAKLRSRLKREFPKHQQTDISQDLRKLRALKTDAEVAQLQNVIDISIAALKLVYDRRQGYEYEYQVEADITHTFRMANATHGFDPIVASGEHNNTIHHISNDGHIDDEDLVLLDIGASQNGYTADLARTYRMRGQPSQRQKDVHQAVLNVTHDRLAHLKLGEDIRTWMDDGRATIGRELKKLGLVTSATDRRQIFEFYPHATGHGLGIDAHDPLSPEPTFQPGTVIMIEPGIYIKNEGFGIRLEDCALLSDTGVTLMSRSLPFDL